MAGHTVKIEFKDRTRFKESKGDLIITAGLKGSKTFAQVSLPESNPLRPVVQAIRNGKFTLGKRHALPTTLSYLSLLKAEVFQGERKLASAEPYGALPQLELSCGQLKDYHLKQEATVSRKGDHFLISCPDAKGFIKVFSPELMTVAFKKLGTAQKRSQSETHFLAILKAFNFLEKKNKRFSSYRKYWEDLDVIFHKSTRMNHKRTGRLNHFGPVAKKIDQAFHKESVPRQGDLPLLKIRSPRPIRKSLRGLDSKRMTFRELSLLLSSLDVGCYPSGGGIYENQFYLLVHDCEQLSPGLYRYIQPNKTLRKVQIQPYYEMLLLENARHSWGSEHGYPRVLIIVTTRFPKISTRYKGIAYRLSLLNAGVIMGNLDRACQQHNLAGCPIGNGDSTVFEAATGIPFFKETSIAEYGVGGRLEK